LNKKAVFFAIGNILLVLAATLFVPLGVSLFDEDPWRTKELFAFGTTAALTATFGMFLRSVCRRPGTELGATEGFAVVSLGWAVVALFGALPFVLSSAIPSFVDAYFETISGFSTTGATILTDIEALPRGMLFWRSLSHWLGGMGIVLLSVAILPALGAGGSQLFNAEVPGISGERLTPRIAETAKTLWKVYLLLTVLEVFFLMLGGLDPYESVCHTFGTMATGGFSTKNSSIGHYGSAYVEWVVIVFMFLAGCNFVLHFHLLRGHVGKVTKNSELRVFASIVIVASVAFAVFLWFAPASTFAGGTRPEGLDSVGGTLRAAAFQTVSITTTTGYGTADFEVWPDFCRLGLVLLMFVGGCSGSTGGSVKVGRVMILGKYALREVRRLSRTRGVFHVRMDGESVEPGLLENVVGFCILFVAVFLAGTFGILVIENLVAPGSRAAVDFVTAATSVAASLGNIGPGLNGVGPTQDFAWFSDASKILLSFLMILGRLEIYCVLVLLAPRVWRR